MNKYLEASVIEIELDENNQKVAHILGDSYYSEDGTDTPYRFVEYSWGYVSLADLINNGMPDGDWYGNLKQYIEDCNADRLNEIYEHYDNGKAPVITSLVKITMATPCGCYILISCQDNNGDGFLVERNDEIDNAVFDAIQSLVPEEIEWDMELIGEVTDCIREILEKAEIPHCHPWTESFYDSECICYNSPSRCPWCKRNS